MKALLAISILVVVSSRLVAVSAAADGERLPSILALMHRQYTVSRAPYKAIKAQSASESPDWSKVEAAGTTFKELATTLAKQSPRKGGMESWRGLIERHLEDARAVERAAQAHDLKALREAERRIAVSCAACHKVHRGRRGD
ncbi:MAG: hypothetical protein AB7I30_06645 [Isosphaeraceae bacterium]